MANKNFTVKNGLEVGGQEVISSSGAITSAALGGQVLGTSASPSFANITTAGYLRGPASFVIDPAAHGDDTGTVVIAGNLQVDGTQTTINSTTMTVDDLNLTLASGAANAAAANGAGINVDITGATNPSLVYGSSNDDWTFNKNLNVTGNIGVTGTVDGIDIAARDAILTSTTTTAGAALPKAGGTMTGSLNIFSSSSDGLVIRTTSNAEPFIALQRNGGNNGVAVLRSIDGGDLKIDTGATGSAQTTKMTIEAGGNVGIGRADPTQLLEVHKDAGGDQTVAKFSAHNYGDTGKTFIEIGTEYGDGSSRIGSFNDTGNKSVLVFDTHDATSGAFAERMRIDSSGNITNKGPDNSFVTTEYASNFAKLDVRGNGILNSKHFLISYGAGHDEANEFALKNGLGPLAFYTATIKRMTIDSLGNVGIGTADPDGFKTKITSAAKGLFVQSGSGGYTSFGFTGDAGTTKGSITSNAGRLYFGSENTGGTGSNGEFLVTPGTGNVMTLHGPTGHVGIGLGTTTPSARLHVLGSSTTEGSIVIFDNAGSPNVNQGNDILFKYSDDNTQVDGNEVSIGGITAKATYASGAYSPIAAAIRVVPSALWTSTSNPTYWAFSTTPAAATVMEERMRIDAAGNLLLNTANSPTTTKAIISADYSAGGTTNTGLTIAGRQSGNWFNNGIHALGSSGLVFSTGTTGVNGADATNERMRIDSSGIVTMPYQPAFHAYGISNNINTVGTTMLFATVTGDRGFNTGGHYSTTTGRFTAPVTGTYQFSWSSIGNALAQVFRMYFKKNNVPQGDMHLRLDGNATGSEYPDNAMYTITYKLVKDDYIEIYNGAGTDWYAGNGDVNNDYYRFMGHLIG